MKNVRGCQEGGSLRREVRTSSTNQFGKGLFQEGAIEEDTPGDEKIATSSKCVNDRGTATADASRSGKIGRSWQEDLEGDGLRGHGGQSMLSRRA